MTAFEMNKFWCSKFDHFYSNKILYIMYKVLNSFFFYKLPSSSFASSAHLFGFDPPEPFPVPVPVASPFVDPESVEVELDVSFPLFLSVWTNSGRKI